jgi:hypothetical protein
VQDTVSKALPQITTFIMSMEKDRKCRVQNHLKLMTDE